MKTQLTAVIVSTLLCAASSLNAQPVGPASIASTSKNAIVRSISLSDLGFADGIEFQQLAGETVLYFPVPDAAPILRGTLDIELDQGAKSLAQRYLKISVGNRVAQSQALSPDGGNLSVKVPVASEDVANGFVKVTLQYSGALSDQVCVDERSSGDFVSIDPSSALTITLDGAKLSAPATVAALMPADVRLVFSDANPANIAVAMNAASSFGAEAGHVHFDAVISDTEANDRWEMSNITIDIAEFGGASQMSVAQMDGLPGFTISGTDPQVGLNQLSSIWIAAAGPQTAQATQVGMVTGDANSLPLTRLNGNLDAQLVSSSSNFQIPFRATDIPGGREITSLSLVASAALDPKGHGATLTAYLNDTILGSRPLKSGDPERMTFDVPEGLISRDNALRVLIQRQPEGGGCVYKVQGYPAQILPGSTFELSAASERNATDFFRLSQQFLNGVDLVVDQGMTMSQGEILEWTVGIAGSILPDGARVAMKGSIGALNGTTPFIIISKETPEGANSDITLDDGAIEIRDAAGNVMFDGQDLDRLGIVHIVTVNGADGLWIRPGSGPAPVLSDRNPLVLDRGNLALIDDSGIVVATSTLTRDLLSVVYPDQTSVMQILAKYRPWIVGGLWAVLTLLVLGVFQRLNRSRRVAKTTD
jgi:hypothetical protein